MSNYSVKNGEKNTASDDEEAPNNSESSSDNKKETREKVVAPICRKPHYLKNLSRHKM